MLPYITCLLTNNDCYKTGRKVKIKGVMVHSTGANNPTIKRYVQPADDDPNSAELLSIIGINHYANDWNHGGISKCVHGFIGKLANGEIGAVQTLPWDYRGWHAGTGTSGKSANDGWISFEICEDGLTDSSYFKSIYSKAVELTAWLCGQYNLDPLADGVVICHHEGYERGIASGHADVEHWFPKHGKSMDDFRRDVAKSMGIDVDEYDVVSAVMVLNIRKKPGTNYAVIGQIRDKLPHTIIAESKGSGAKLWGQLKENKYWIALDYTKPADNIPQGKVIATAGLNVRVGPGTNYARVKTLSYGTIVPILSEQNGWGEIGVNQWVFMQYIKKL